MKVDDVLTGAVVRIERSATLEAAARLMKEKHVGALLVTEDAPHTDRLAGIVTDRDIVLLGVAQNIRPSTGSVAQVMTSGLASVELGTQLDDALELMKSRGVRRIAVLHPDGRLAGVVALDDIMDALGHELAGLSRILRSEIEREMASR